MRPAVSLIPYSSTNGMPSDSKNRNTAGDAGAPPERKDGPVKEPEPEEVPELLGERSDYPIPSGDDREALA